MAGLIAALFFFPAGLADCLFRASGSAAESGRWNVQLRGEFFNVTNYPNPNGFGSTNNTSTSFGEITSFRAPRIVQIGARLIW